MQNNRTGTKAGIKNSITGRGKTIIMNKKPYTSYEAPIIVNNITSRMAQRLNQSIYNHFNGTVVEFIAMNQNDTTITGDLKLKFKTNKNEIETIRNFAKGFIAGINAVS